MTGATVRVLLQQNIVAHYRRALYRRLSVSPTVHFDFVFDGRSDTPFLETVAPGELSGGALMARVLLLPFGLTLQPGAIREAISTRPDVIIAMGSPYSLTSWLLMLSRPLHRARVLLWTHGLLREESGPKWWLRRRFYQCADGLLLYGDRARTLLAEHLPGVPLHVVYNGLDEEKLSACLKESRQEPVAEARRRLGCSEAERVLLFIGRLQPVKRLDLLIESVARLRARGRRVAALIVGEGEEEAALRQLCRDRDVVGDVHFLGPCHEERTTAGYFRAADVCVIPSGAGLTVMHSLSYETPVVTHDDFGEQFPEIEALRPGENALLFSHGDLESLVQALERALFPVPLKDGLVASGNALDERFTSAEQARRMVKAAHATVEAAHS